MYIFQRCKNKVFKAKMFKAQDRLSNNTFTTNQVVHNKPEFVL